MAQQTAFLAGRTGFHVTALEDRPFFADAMRKAGADQVICDSFENALKGISGSRNTYFLVLTRGHRYDGICLKSILQKERAYTGMMASRGRAAAMRRQLKEEGIPEDVLNAIHSPVGLSIHAETPQEIAVSITAELIQEKNRFRKSMGYDDELLAFLTGEKNPGGKIALATIVDRRGIRAPGDRNKNGGASGRAAYRNHRWRLYGEPGHAPVPSYPERSGSQSPPHGRNPYRRGSGGRRACLRRKDTGFFWRFCEPDEARGNQRRRIRMKRSEINKAIKDMEALIKKTRI